MRYAFCLTTVLACLLAVPALADDGNVPQSTLNALGLAGMQTVSDQEGMQVRGMSGRARSMGLSLVTGLLIDPATSSYVLGVDTNAARSSAQNAGHRVRTEASHMQASTVDLSLYVETHTGVHSVFYGYLVGGAGGSGMAGSR